MNGFLDDPIYVQDLRTALEATVNTQALRGAAVLVTGVTGTIGSFVTDMLCLANRELNLGIAIYAAGRRPEEMRRRFAREAGVTCVPYDMMKPISFSHDVDYVIHGAGNAHPAAFADTPVETLLSSVQGTHALLEYARERRAKRLLYISSGEVYGQVDSAKEKFGEEDIGYVDPVSPRSCYPNGKRAAETLCAAYAKEYGVESVIVRPCHTYGPTLSPADTRAHAQFFRNALRGEDIVLKSAGAQLRSYCYVADCASALLTALTAGVSGQAYNLANPREQLTIAGFARAVAEAAGGKVRFENPSDEDIARRTPVARQVLDTRKIESLGWDGKFTTSCGVAHTLAVLKSTIGR